MENLTLLKNLCLKYGISGNEKKSELSKFLYKTVNNKNDNTYRDKYGNIISVIGNGDETIMIDSHMDEVGFKVKSKTRNHIYLEPIGRIDFKLVQNNSLTHLNSGNTGKIIGKGIAVFDNCSSIKKDDLISYKKNFKIEGNLIKATALDNRIGCYISIKILDYLVKERNLNKRVVFVFSVREEIEKSQLNLIVKELKINRTIVLDAAYAKPYPSNYKNVTIPELGNGVAIQTQGEGFVIKNKTLNIIKDIAKKNNLKFQFETPHISEGRTSLSSLKKKDCCDCCAINTPVRNQHQETGIANLEDLNSNIKLIKLLINNKDN
jgi:tetrahedral aminopeptidase